MSKRLQIILLFFLIASLIFTSFYIRDFRIDASSDSLVSQNDEDFKYFSYYQDMFPTKKTIVYQLGHYWDIHDDRSRDQLSGKKCDYFFIFSEWEKNHY